MIYCEDGVQTTDEDKIKAEIGATDASTGGEVEQLSGLLPHKLTTSMKATLASEIPKEEIVSAIKHMPSNKSHGPCGYNVEFFRVVWDIVGEQMIVSVQEFFNLREATKIVQYCTYNPSTKVSSSKQSDRLQANLLF